MILSKLFSPYKKIKELEEQIKKLKSTNTPESVWIDGFSVGFSKAWDVMIPIMRDGMDKTKTQIKNDAIEESIKRINKVRSQKAEWLDGND